MFFSKSFVQHFFRMYVIIKEKRQIYSAREDCMKRFLSLTLCAVMLVCTFGICPVSAAQMTDSGIDYKDSTLTFDKNPGRGVAKYTDTANWIVCGNGQTRVSQKSDFDECGVYTPMFQLAAFSSGNDYTYEGRTNVSNAGKKVVGGENIPIDAQTLGAIEAAFEGAKQNGVLCIPRFAYDYEGFVGSEPDELMWIIYHIEQISRVINKYKGTVIAVECGMIGPYGEMWGNKYLATGSETSSQNAIVGAWLDNLDPSINVLTRKAEFILKYLNVYPPKFKKMLPLSPDSPAYRLGMYNDGYLYDDGDCGTWSGGQSLIRSEGINFLSSQALRMPYGGELGYAKSEQSLVDGNSPIYTGSAFISELYDTHLSYLRNIASSSQVTASALRKVYLSESDVSEDTPDISEYYGKDLNKFITDHMGYRFVIREAKVQQSVAKGSVATLTGKIENTGFGNLLFNPYCSLVIVSESGNATVTDAYVDAKKWTSATTSEYKIMLSVPDTAAAGEYKVYLRLSTSPYGELSSKSAGAVQFANAGVYSSSYGANYIGTVTVSDTVGGRATEFLQVNNGSFKDVAPGAWYESAVYSAVSDKLMSGMGDGIFSPETNASRAMLVRVLYNLEGTPDTSDMKNPFTDVAENEWYESAVKWAYANKIVAGTSEREFSPSDDITRQQFAAILYRYATYKGYNTESRADMSVYTDFDKAEQYAKEALSWARATGFITGMTETTMNPGGNATRAQTASILERFLLAYGL